MPPPVSRNPKASARLDDVVELLECIREPAIVVLPGGRIAAVNRAASLLPEPPVPGETIGMMIGRYRGRRSDGSPMVPGDLPCARALRGEVVGHGERFELTFPDGTVYRTLITSKPVVRDGRVVAVLSVWHDFGEYIRELSNDR